MAQTKLDIKKWLTDDDNKEIFSDIVEDITIETDLLDEIINKIDNRKAKLQEIRMLLMDLKLAKNK